MKLAFSRWGQANESSEKIIFLHGMGGTGSLWRPIAASLEKDFNLIALDQRGHGGSQIAAKPGGRDRPKYTPLEFGRDIVETLDAENFHPAWVVGHSMGVRTACAVVHLKPEWVKGLVLVDLGFSGVAGGGLGENLAEFLKKIPMRFATRAEGREFMAREAPDPAIGQYLMAVALPGSQPGEIIFPFDRAALIETIHSARDSSVREWIREAGAKKIPVLVLRGETSTVWTQEQFEQEQKNLAEFPSIQFETFPGTGHGLPFEKRIEFVDRLRKFIASGNVTP
ncbi:alpha/beta hydrolase [bacterium]|nr:alpha/beta hydrolase [bacterium]